jgi:hypothetical protein
MPTDEPATASVGATAASSSVAGEIVPPTPVPSANARFGLFGRQ